MYLAEMLVHLVEGESEREEPLGGLAARPANEAVAPHCIERRGMGGEGLLNVNQGRRLRARAQRGSAGAQEIFDRRRNLPHRRRELRLNLIRQIAADCAAEDDDVMAQP
jgi:hypothetical protein